MTKGSLVIIGRDPLAIGVLLQLDSAGTARILPWNAAKGRWAFPVTIATYEPVPSPVEDIPLQILTLAAIKNIRRYSGVVSYGTQRIRVWPNSAGPEAAS